MPGRRAVAVFFVASFLPCFSFGSSPFSGGGPAVTRTVSFAERAAVANLEDLDLLQLEVMLRSTQEEELQVLLEIEERLTADLEWLPQRLVFWALAISVAAVALALALALSGRRVRSQESNRAVTILGLRTPVSTTSWPVALALTGGMALVAAATLNTMPVMALVVGASLLVSLRLGRDVPLPALAGLASFGLSALYIVVQQVRHTYPTDFLWPLQFERVHTLGVVAVLFLAAEIVRVVAARISNSGDGRRPPGEPDPDEAPERVKAEP
jgi:lysylphosphatidylglycerol synthetase-like protein (DUF2156 family)